LNYEYRMHDTRIGRFFAIDPLFTKYPWNSPYAFSENRVIDMIELEGLEAANTKDKAESQPTIDVKTGKETTPSELDEVYITNSTGAKIVNATKDIAVSAVRPALETSKEFIGGMLGASSISNDLNANYNAKYAPSTDEKDAAIICGIPAIIVAAEVGAIAYVVYEGGGYLWSQGASLWASQTAELTWGKALWGMGSNGLSQWTANNFDWRKINGIEVGMSAFGTYSSTLIGETFSWNWKERKEGIQSPKSWDHAALQIGGGLFSNYMGNKIGSGVFDGSKGLFGSAAGRFYKESSCFIIETSSNVLPNFADKLHPELEGKK
jgi:hypothetical protein